MSTLKMWVCTTCFELTSAGKGMQRCRCEKYQAYPGIDCPNGFHLCYMCAALVVGGTSRYSWNACKTCLSINREFSISSGHSLPLGRHSIMNGIAVPLGAEKEVQETVVQRLLSSIQRTEEIKSWGNREARALFSTVATWKLKPLISSKNWEVRFKMDEMEARLRSTSAFERFLKS